jgi:hypothetical protein
VPHTPTTNTHIHTHTHTYKYVSSSVQVVARDLRVMDDASIIVVDMLPSGMCVCVCACVCARKVQCWKLGCPFLDSCIHHDSVHAAP